MKKILIFLASIATLLVCFNFAGKASNTFINGEINTCLGKSINLIKAGHYGAYARSSILDNEYCESIEVSKSTFAKKAESYYVSGKTVEAVRVEIDAKYSYSSNLNGLEYKGFTFGASTKFDFMNGFDYSSYYSRSFVEYVGKIDQGIYYIPEGNVKQDEYSKHLSTAFINCLNKLKSGAMSYSKFFDAFGTHLITSYVYGDRLYLDSYVLSNEVIIDDSFAVNFSKSVDASFLDMNGSSGITAGLSSKLGIKKSNTIYDCKISCASGKLYNPTFDNITDSIADWVNYANSTSFDDTIVEYLYDSFVPVWEVLPEDSPISPVEMQHEFEKYQNENSIKYSSESANDFNNVYRDAFIRDDEKTIEDKDRFTYKEKFEISRKFSLEFIKAAFNIIEFEISFNAARINKGYHLFYLYNELDADKKI